MMIEKMGRSTFNSRYKYHLTEAKLMKSMSIVATVVILIVILSFQFTGAFPMFACYSINVVLGMNGLSSLNM